MKIEEPSYHKHPVLNMESWTISGGLLHRKGGPAKRRYYCPGALMYEVWMQHGKGHRTDGPAYIGLNTSGEIEKVQWLLNGVDHTMEEWLAEVDLPRDEAIALKLLYG